MEGTTNFWTLIGNSIFHNDLYILIAAVTTEPIAISSVLLQYNSIKEKYPYFAKYKKI